MTKVTEAEKKEMLAGAWVIQKSRAKHGAGPSDKLDRNTIKVVASCFRRDVRTVEKALGV